MWAQGPVDLGPSPLLSQDISEELQWKCSSWDWNWHHVGITCDAMVLATPVLNLSVWHHHLLEGYLHPVAGSTWV